MQTQKIGELLKVNSRDSLAMICMQCSNLLADEPTNHLDLEAIDALAEAIKRYNGGLVLYRTIRLIDQVAKICKVKSIRQKLGQGYSPTKNTCPRAEKEALERKAKV